MSTLLSHSHVKGQTFRLFLRKNNFIIKSPFTLYPHPSQNEPLFIIKLYEIITSHTPVMGVNGKRDNRIILYEQVQFFTTSD